MKRAYASGAQKRKRRRTLLSDSATSSRAIETYFNVQSSSSLKDNPVECDIAPLDPDIDDPPCLETISESSHVSTKTPESKQNSACEGSREESTVLPVEVSDVDVSISVQQKPSSGISSDKSFDEEVSLFDLSHSHPTDRGHYPSTIYSTTLKEMIVAHGSCRPNDVDDRIQKHYCFRSSGNLKIDREWLCYSPVLEKAYCEVCWLFGNRQNSAFRMEWVAGVGVDDKKSGLSKRVKVHEQSQSHVEATHIYRQWKEQKRVDQAIEKNIRDETNTCRKVLTRVIHIILTMSSMCIALRGHTETIGDFECQGGNFLALVNLMALYDPILENILSKKSGATRYLSPTIQNELIEDMKQTLRSCLVNQISSAPFFSIIADTTSDVSRVDQLSVIVRWVDGANIQTCSN